MDDQQNQNQQPVGDQGQQPGVPTPPPAEPPVQEPVQTPESTPTPTPTPEPTTEVPPAPGTDQTPPPTMPGADQQTS